MKLLLLIGAVLAVIDNCDAASPWIVNGETATYGEHPYICSLQVRFLISYSHSCGAVVYNNKNIITAAHCVDSSGSRRVQCGLHRLNNADDYQVTVTVNRCKVHENWNSNGDGYPNDIAICELATPLTFNDYVSPIEIDDGSASWAGQDCTLSGWGRTVGGGSLPNYLQKVNITKITNDRCSQLWQSVTGASIFDSHICFFDEVGQDKSACNGDSGGPVRCSRNGKKVLTGLTSWGISTCSGAYPSVYTRVSKYSSWLAANAYP